VAVDGSGWQWVAVDGSGEFSRAGIGECDQTLSVRLLVRKLAGSKLGRLSIQSGE